MSQEERLTDIWQKYEKSRDYLDGKGLLSKTDECWRFYLGDQWHGLESGGERLPSLNFIKGVVRYKTAVIAQNSMVANYTPEGREPEMLEVCEALNKYFRTAWEKGKMDSNLWDIVKAAQVQGESYLFYGTPSDMQPQILSNVNVLLSDEQEQNIQCQKYILIYERRFVSDVIREAKENEVAADIIETIVSDDETKYQIGDITEVKESAKNDGKCASILYLKKDDDGIVHMARSTKTCIYQPDTKLQGKDSQEEYAGIGLKSYPIVSFIWEKVPNNARGQSEVRNLIPNQLELNKTLARRSMAVKLGAFPRLAYDEQAITNPESLDSVGMKVAVRNTSASNINNMIAYLHPTSMSPDAKNLADELMNSTRELAGAGETATGAVDPTQASGAAIIAVKNQNELPLNESVATKTQFVEDLALLWFDMWAAYNPNGLEVDMGEEGTMVVPSEVLSSMRVNIRVDVSQANPFSKLAQEQALERLLAEQRITFEEYIEALDDDSNVPKAKIKDILQKRQEQQENEMAMQLEQAMKTIESQEQTIAELTGQPLVQPMMEQNPMMNDMGGMPYEMPAM